MQRRWPTLFLSAVHYLVAREPSDPLARFYGSITEEPGPAGEAYPDFRRFCLGNASQLESLMAERTTQTNEVGRCGYLLPGIEAIAREAQRPLALVEFGCSAGLNLVFDRYRYEYVPGGELGDGSAPVTIRTEVRGDRVPPLPQSMPSIGFRVGLDKSPVDVRDPDARAWLEACVWPEQRERRLLLDGAFQAALNDPPRIVRGDAVDDLDALLETVPTDLHLVVYNTTVLPYIEPDRQAPLREKLQAIVSQRDATWLFCEAALMGPDLLPEERGRIANIDATDFVMGVVTNAGGRLLASTGPHGKWLQWLDEGRHFSDG